MQLYIYIIVVDWLPSIQEGLIGSRELIPSCTSDISNCVQIRIWLTVKKNIVRISTNLRGPRKGEVLVDSGSSMPANPSQHDEVRPNPSYYSEEEVHAEEWDSNI